MDAFAKQDATALSKLYTEDCKLMPTGADVVNGREGEATPMAQIPLLNSALLVSDPLCTACNLIELTSFVMIHVLEVDCP